MRIFLSTPISCFKEKKDLINYKKEIITLLLALKKDHNVCSEIESIDSETDYDTPEKSISMDLDSIQKCDVFILHYPKQTPTSALIELGVAIAYEKKIIIVTPQASSLPYLALGISTKCPKSQIIESSSINQEVICKIQANLIKYNI